MENWIFRGMTVKRKVKVGFLVWQLRCSAQKKLNKKKMLQFAHFYNFVTLWTVSAYYFIDSLQYFHLCRWCSSSISPWIQSIIKVALRVLTREPEDKRLGKWINEWIMATWVWLCGFVGVCMFLVVVLARRSWPTVLITVNFKLFSFRGPGTSKHNYFDRLFDAL